jgi:hypothetical protein
LFNAVRSRRNTIRLIFKISPIVRGTGFRAFQVAEGLDRPHLEGRVPRRYVSQGIGDQRRSRGVPARLQAQTKIDARLFSPSMVAAWSLTDKEGDNAAHDEN